MTRLVNMIYLHLLPVLYCSERGGHYDLYCVHLSICWYREVYVDRLMYHHYNSAQCTDTNILIYQ